MKAIHYIYFAMVLAACGQNPAGTTGTETHAHNAGSTHEKTVVLNAAQYKAAGIETGGFEKKNLAEVVQANGYTKLPPQNRAEVSVPITGNIKRIAVTEGQYIRAGQVLATMESPEIARTVEAYQTAKSNTGYMEKELERQKSLAQENINARKTLEKATADLDAEKAKLQSLQEQLRMLNIFNPGNVVSSVNIVAPISGHVTTVNVSIGSTAQPGKPLFEMVDNSKLHVDLLVYEKDLFKVKTGQSVRFILTNQSNLEVNGKIFSVGQAFENETKSVAVHADILNEKTGLIPGMYVNALIDIGMQTVDALPEDAIVKAEGREFIFVQEAENGHEEEHDHEGEDEHAHEESEAGNTTFARIEVKTGITQLGYKQVTLLQEIHAGDKIVVKGAYYLQAHLQKSQGGGGHAH